MYIEVESREWLLDLERGGVSELTGNGCEFSEGKGNITVITADAN